MIMASGHDSNDETDPVLKKRILGRRLAVNACVWCRERKTKCDEARPACGRCSRLKLSCSYLESSQRRDNIILAGIQEHLQRLETKIDNICRGNETSKLDSSSSGVQPQLSFCSPLNSTTWPNQLSPLVIQDDRESQLAIPQWHSTPPQNMLLWPFCQGHFHNEDLLYPLRIELFREKMTENIVLPRILAHHDNLHWLDNISLSHFRTVSGAYFRHFHPRNMILRQNQFHEQDAAKALQIGFDRNLSSCTVLLVLAIGSIAAVEEGHLDWASSETDPNVSPECDATGHGFFIMALSILKEVHDTSWASVQCWLLVAFYYSLKGRLFDQWQSLNKAGTAVMLLLRITPQPLTLHCQLYWVVYLQESQLLAEFDFPPTSITRLENSIPLPFAGDEEQDECQREFQFMFLAEISIRRLLNRIHFHLYECEHYDLIDAAVTPPNLAMPPSSLISELDNQVEAWRIHLPSPLQFEVHAGSEDHLNDKAYTRTLREKMMGTLKAKYFAAKAILYRPFVYKMLNTPNNNLSLPEDLIGARVGLEAALRVSLHSGLLCDNLRLIPLLINPTRSFFACAILYKFVSMKEKCLEALPSNWRLIHHIRDRLYEEVVAYSPVIAHDLNLLKALEDLPLSSQDFAIT